MLDADYDSEQDVTEMGCDALSPGPGGPPCQAGGTTDEPLITMNVSNPSLSDLEGQDDRLFRIIFSKLSVPVYGFVSPPIILFTVITNSLVCLVLLKRNMRSASNIILVGMALSDTLTGVFPLPCYVFFFTLGAWHEHVPYEWCYAYSFLTNHIPTIFHSASVWLTVGLAGHRYMCVCHSLVAKKWCTVANVVKGIAFLYLAAVLLQLMRFVELSFSPIQVPSRLGTGLNVTTCAQTWLPILRQNLNVYFNVYYWFRVVFVHLVPCTMLIVLNALLVQTMRTAQARRRLLLKQNRKSECRRLAESNLTTMMLVAVVGLFLLVELPMALLFIVMIIDNTLELKLFDDAANSAAPLWINLFILLSYPLNFFIYCGMSRQFRLTFKRLFVGGGGGGADMATIPAEQTQYVTVADANGSTVVANKATTRL